MYLSTFNDEKIVDTPNLVVKSLFILAFITPTALTNVKIQESPYRDELEQVRYNSIVSKYAFLSLINPLGWDLITKNLPKPDKRQGLEEDFLMIESNTLHHYFQIVNVISNTIALN